MEQLRVLLANQHPIVRNGLRSLLERNSCIRVVGEAASGREAIVLTEYQHPDVAVLDVTLDAIGGVNPARAIVSKEPRTRVVVLGDVADEGYVQEALDAGARGYVLSDSAQNDLPRSVLVAAAGGVFLSPAVSYALLEDWNRVRTFGQPVCKSGTSACSHSWLKGGVKRRSQ